MDRGQLKLDDAVFSGRLKLPPMPAGHTRRAVTGPARRVNDIYTPRFKAYAINSPEKHTPKIINPVALSEKAAQILPAPTGNQPHPLGLGAKSLPDEYSHWLTSGAPEKPQPKHSAAKSSGGRNLFAFRPSLAYAMAVAVFAIGLYVSFIGLKTNSVAQAQITKISKQAQSANNSSVSAPPLTTKPTPQQINSYAVAPGLPRYIDIPAINVHARVLQTTVKADGSLGTPGNVYDTAWYSTSSKPGEAGAMLIDGHISSWTTKGVFYNLDHLVAGNVITITRGDGKTFNYKVVKTSTAKASAVDMASLLVSQNTGKPGLNLISCSGDVIPGTNEFDKRIVIYSVLE